jgi:hypothetical protein
MKNRLFCNKKFDHRFDEPRAMFEEYRFERCVFDHCGLSNPTKDPTLRTTVRNVTLKNCTALNCNVGPAILEDILIDGLQTIGKAYGQELLVWAPLCKHVTLRGVVGMVTIHRITSVVDFSEARETVFRLDRDRYYKGVDWALDISEAVFQSFSMIGAIPVHLIRRDAKTQVVVTQKKAKQKPWRRKVPSWNWWLGFVTTYATDGDTVLVAPKGIAKKDFELLRDGLENLRDLGVAEPN